MRTTTKWLAIVLSVTLPLLFVGPAAAKSHGQKAGEKQVAALLAVGAASPPQAHAAVRPDPNEIVTLLPKDAIPAILNPRPLLVTADAVNGVRATDQVLGVAIGGESRAYPIPFLELARNR